MANKVIYFSVHGRHDQVEFHSDDKSEDVRELFRAAAEAPPTATLKLYNSNGNIMAISVRTPPNCPKSRYALEVVSVSHVNDQLRMKSDKRVKNSAQIISSMNQRLTKMEKALPKDDYKSPEVKRLQTTLESLTHKLECLEYLSWLGLSKKMFFKHSRSNSFSRSWSLALQSVEENNQRVFDKFMTMTNVQLSPQVRQQLKKTTFDNWQWDFPEMLMLLRQMFIDLGLVSKFKIPMDVLCNWLYAVFSEYHHVSFHNFQHCFMVSQMLYGIMWLVDLPSKLSALEILTLMISAICHDVSHPGYNNSYQINARTSLALRYNDISPLENHHCSVTFQIMDREGCNILENLTEAQYRQARGGIIRCILSTDLSSHNEHLKAFKAVVPHFDFGKKEHRNMLMIHLVKTADVSNECRPMEVSGPWLDCLLQEFYIQGDTEKLEGLQVSPHMDRDTASVPTSQIAFIQVLLLPLLETLAELFPQLEADVVKPAHRALKYYREMQSMNEESHKMTKPATRSSSEDSAPPHRDLTFLIHPSKNLIDN